MAKNRKNWIIILFSIIIIELIVGKIDILPWWSFVAPIMFLGILIGYKKVNITTFTTGFTAGFIVWSLGNIYFDISGSGLMIKRMASLLYIHKAVFLLTTGLIGGLLTGLALYTGKTVMQAFQSGDRN